jgi:hypothetical protein
MAGKAYKRKSKAEKMLQPYKKPYPLTRQKRFRIKELQAARSDE